MKLWVFSDLHLDQDKWLAPVRNVPDADVAVVAGDVLHGGAAAVRWLGEEVSRRMPVVCVLGNHEFYGGTIADDRDLARIEAAHWDGVHLLDDSETVVGGARFVGGTLWTDWMLYGDAWSAAEAMTTARRFMNDYRAIKWSDGEKFAPRHAADMHVATRRYLGEALARPHDGPTVVVTHHAPHRGSIHPRWRGDHMTPAFVSDLSPLVEGGGAVAWVHGHVHDSFDYVAGGTRVLCNPRGYGRENPAFDPALVVEV